MNDTPASSTEKTVVVYPAYNRLRLLTILSLCLNGLILLLILAGIVAHHHRMHEQAQWGARAGEGFHGGHHGFHHFGRQEMGDRGRGGWNRGGGFGGARFDQRDRGGFDRPEFRGGEQPGGFSRGRGGEEGPGAGFGDHRGGMGMMGPKGGDVHDPAKMTDAILAHLTQQLTLTDDQKAKIKPIVEAQVAQMQKEIEAQRQAMQKEIEDGKAKIKPLLNADQQKQLDAMPLPGQKPTDKGTDAAKSGA